MLISVVQEGIIVPEKATEGSVGFDLFAPKEIVLKAGARVSVDLGIQIQLPPGTFGLIKERSSYAAIGLLVIGGVIDNDYRGNVEVLLWNSSEVSFKIGNHWKFAQLLCVKYESPTVYLSDRLTKTERGAGGFSSTGM